MRSIAVLLLAQLVAAAPLAAQFEGTVNMKISGTSAGGEMALKMVVKGDQQATLLTLPQSAGPMAGMEMRMVYDPKTSTATSLMPIPPAMQQMPAFANAKGIKTIVDLAKMTVNANDETVDVKKLGTTERIAGIECEDYEITSSKGNNARACIAPSLGHFLFPQMSSGMGGRGTGAPAWTKAFGHKSGFPLKVWSTNGDVAMEVTSIEKGSVSATLFEIPDDYVDMSALFRGRGGH